MDELEASQREAVKKIFTLRLSAKLLEVGLEEAKIQAMDQGQMMESWAAIVAAGKDKPVATIVAAGKDKPVATIVAAGKDKPVATGVIGYDPELERRRLDFEMQKFEEEKILKQRELQNSEKEKILKILVVYLCVYLIPGVLNHVFVAGPSA